MSDYRTVAEALASGASPKMLCMTCPWDRYCVTPPTMTRQDVEKKMKDAAAKDQAKEEKGGAQGMPINTLLNLVTYASKDIEALICPVFALRLRASEGRVIVDGLKARMKEWTDE